MFDAFNKQMASLHSSTQAQLRDLKTALKLETGVSAYPSDRKPLAQPATTEAHCANTEPSAP